MTRAEDQEARRLADAGVSLREIGRRMAREHKTIQAAIERDRRRPPPPKGLDRWIREGNDRGFFDFLGIYPPD